MNEKDYFVHESAYIDENVRIGKGTKIWHFTHVQDSACIGNDCSIGQNVNIANDVSIGNHVKIQNNVSVYEGVVLEDYVFCGPSMVFTNVKYPRSKYPVQGRACYIKTVVKEGATIGANATILCGNTIGKNAFIAAGSVITTDVPDYGLMIGSPAERKGWVCECGEKLDDKLNCKKCNKNYEACEKGLREVTE